MTEEGIYLFLQTLAIDTDKIKKSKDWLMMTCPLAFHTHEGGKDNHPSFFISIAEDRPSVWHCFGCTEKPRSLIALLHDFWLMTGKYPYDAANIYSQYETHSESDGFDKIIYTDIWNNYSPRAVDPLPFNDVISKFPTLQSTNSANAKKCKEYLRSRGIADHIFNMCKVRYDGGLNLVFPFTDIMNDIYILRMRNIVKKKIWTVTSSPTKFSDIDFPTIKDAGVFFGMELVDFSRPIMIVEAPISAMRLMTLGCFNVMASGTSMITRTQVRAVFSDSIVSGFDADVAGRKANKRVKNMIGNDIILSEVDWSIVNDGCGKPCNDPGDLLNKKDLIKVLRNKKTY